MAHTIHAEVRPTRKLFWGVVIVPGFFLLAKNVISTDTKQLIPDLVFYGGIVLVALVAALISARGTRLQRRGNDLVLCGHRVPVTDVDLVDVVPFDPSGKVYGREARDLDQLLILRRRSGAQPVIIDVTLCDFDQIKQLFAGCGITVTESNPKSVKQIEERFPGARFDAMERHPVLQSFIASLVCCVLVFIYLAIHGFDLS